VEGELLPAWAEETFEECLLSVAIYLQITQVTKDLASKSVEVRFLPRLRFHALALSGLYLRRQSGPIEPRSLIRNLSAFEDFWGTFWQIAKAVLVDVYSQAEDQDSTMFALVRSGERWQQMQKRFNRHLASL
jgi:hypothetical protein